MKTAKVNRKTGEVACSGHFQTLKPLNLEFFLFGTKILAAASPKSLTLYHLESKNFVEFCKLGKSENLK